MGKITEPGRYNVRPVEWSIKVEEGKCPQFVVAFVTDEGETITGFFTLLNKDNTPNVINLKALHKALGWDGNSFDGLENGDWSQAICSIVVEEDEYDGKTSLKVRYLNPKGGMKAPVEAIRSLDAKYGSAIRNALGVEPASPAAKHETAANPIDKAKRAAWAAFGAKTPNTPAPQRVDKFKAFLAEWMPSKDPKNFDDKDWIACACVIDRDYDEATGYVIPF